MFCKAAPPPTHAKSTDVIAGYTAPPGAEPGVTNLTICPEDTYRAGDVPFKAAAGVPCTPCRANMVTQAEGETSADACVAPPGYGWNAATGAASICPLGTFKWGWDRSGCTPCGAGTITTAAPGADSPDDCLTPAGHGTVLQPDGTLLGAPCPAGTFGRSAPTSGQVEVECSRCPFHSTTNGTGNTDPLDCVVQPGYGWEDTRVRKCDFGTFNPGGNHDRCTECGYAYNTSRGGAAITGATSQADCSVAAGWTSDGAGGLVQCSPGTYKSAFGPSACVQCPAGTTTRISGAVGDSDCEMCRPGFGNPSIDLSKPSCTICPSGTYSYGSVPGGQPCLPCPTPGGYAGAMASAQVSQSMLWGAYITSMPSPKASLHVVAQTAHHASMHACEKVWCGP